VRVTRPVLLDRLEQAGGHRAVKGAGEVVRPPVRARRSGHHLLELVGVGGAAVAPTAATKLLVGNGLPGRWSRTAGTPGVCQGGLTPLASPFIAGTSVGLIP